jgi:hypothetical protein
LCEEITGDPAHADARLFKPMMRWISITAIRSTPANELVEQDETRLRECACDLDAPQLPSSKAVPARSRSFSIDGSAAGRRRLLDRCRLRCRIRRSADSSTARTFPRP